MRKKSVSTRKSDVLWKILESKDVFVVEPRFRVSVQKVKLPDGRTVNDYYQIHFPESVIIVARTLDNKIVMSRQYLHGFGKVSVVLPGGTVENGNTPFETAKRELLEETGYSAKKWFLLSSTVPHVNHICGKVHIFFADNAKKVVTPSSNDLEEMEIILMSENETINAIKKKEIISLGTITALTLAKIFLS